MVAGGRRVVGIRRAATIVAAGLLALVLAACGSLAAPARLPWARAQGLRIGVQGWWNGAVLPGHELPATLGTALKGASPLGCGGPPPSEAYTLTLLLPGGASVGPVAWQGARLWWRGCAYRTPDAASWALAGAVAVARRAWSGQLLPWEQVSSAFPIGAQATVIDWVSGRSLHVIRWGGVHHADVEPVTDVDAAALRAIYGGVWSWARRPVVVVLADGERVAASINGMPHGGGSIGSNTFSGHFCVHFLGSEVHRNDRIDERHLMAILTAAGAFGDGPKAAASELSTEAAAAADPASACG